MAALVRLKNEFTEDEKYHNLMSCPNYYMYIAINIKLKSAIKAEEQACRYHSISEHLLNIGTLTQMSSHVSVA